MTGSSMLRRPPGSTTKIGSGRETGSARGGLPRCPRPDPRKRNPQDPPLRRRFARRAQRPSEDCDRCTAHLGEPAVPVSNRLPLLGKARPSCPGSASNRGSRTPRAPSWPPFGADAVLRSRRPPGDVRAMRTAYRARLRSCAPCVRAFALQSSTVTGAVRALGRRTTRPDRDAPRGANPSGSPRSGARTRGGSRWTRRTGLPNAGSALRNVRSAVATQCRTARTPRSSAETPRPGSPNTSSAAAKTGRATANTKPASRGARSGAGRLGTGSERLRSGSQRLRSGS